MTRNSFNQTKNEGAPSISPVDSWHNLTLSKARGLFLEDIDIIDMKDNYKITNVHHLIDKKMLLIKSIVTITYYHLLIKLIFLSKNITELRKGDFDKVTTEALQLNKVQVNEQIINAFN